LRRVEDSHVEGAMMVNGFVVAAGLLISVFAWSGATKVRHPLPPALAMARFGVVRGIHPGLGRSVGLLEVLIAALLLLFPTGPAPLVMAVGLLALFEFLIIRTLRSSDRFPCACFGGDDEVLSAWTAVRTGALLTVAAVATAVATLVSIPSVSLATSVEGVVIGALGLCIASLLSDLRRVRPFSVRLGSDV